jgi:hypothetical protein
MAHFTCWVIRAGFLFTLRTAPFQLTESFETTQNFGKPIRIGGGVDHSAAA